MPPNTLTHFILEGQAEDQTMKEVRTALGLTRGYSAEGHSIPATLLR
jgi:hypothetical protein